MKRGQTLVVLLVFMAIAVTITTAAVMVIISSSKSATDFEIGTSAYYVAETGAEEGLIRLLRNPSYAGGTLTVGPGTATITVTGGIVTSTATDSGTSRTIVVSTQRNNGIMSVTNWRETYP